MIFHMTHHFVDDILKRIWLNVEFWISIKIYLGAQHDMECCIVMDFTLQVSCNIKQIGDIDVRQQ